MGLNENPEPQGTMPVTPRFAGATDDVQSHSSNDRLPDETLARAKQGDQDAFTALVEQHQGRVYRLVIRVLSCDRHTAADISQEVFMRAFRAIDSFDGRALFSTWLHTITMNYCITEYRKRKALKRNRPTYSLDAPIQGYEDLSMDPASRELDPSTHLHNQDIATAVRAAVQELPDEFKDCVVLRDMEGQSYEEIAEILQLAPGTVRSRIHRGRLLLQQKLKGFMS